MKLRGGGRDGTGGHKKNHVRKQMTPVLFKCKNQLQFKKKKKKSQNLLDFYIS